MQRREVWEAAERPLESLLRPASVHGAVEGGFLAQRDFSAEVAARREAVLAQRPPNFRELNRRAVAVPHTPVPGTRSLGTRSRTSTPGPLLGPPQPRSNNSASGASYVRRNSAAAAHAPRLEHRAAASAPAPASVRHSYYGRPPTYLAAHARARHEESLATDALQSAALEAALTPHGMRLVAALEREAALALLREAHEAALAELRVFPLALSTAWRQRKRAELQTRLEELEQALALFSRPRVYLPEDTPAIGAVAEEEEEEEDGLLTDY